MASFPFRRTKGGFFTGTRRRLGRRPRGRSARPVTLARETLASETLEQRTLMAVDSCPDVMPYVLSEDAGCVSEEIIVYSPCMSPTGEVSEPFSYGMPQDMSPEIQDDSPCEPPVLDAPSADPSAGGMAPAMDDGMGDDFLRSMALLAAQADADARRQASEEADRQEQMLAEMDAFFQGIFQTDDCGVFGESSGAVESATRIDGLDPPVGEPEQQSCIVSPAVIGEADAIPADAPSEADGGPTAGAADPGQSEPDRQVEEAVGTASLASEPIDEGVAPVVAAATAEEASSEEPMPTAEPSSDVEYVYDWELEEQKRQADESRERLIHEVCEYATKLNIDSEGRFAEGIVYTEDELVARLQAHIDAPRAIEGVEYMGCGDDAGLACDEAVGGDPLAAFQATVVPPRGMPMGIASGVLADNAQYFQEMGGVVGAVGHMVNGTAAGIVSLFDVVAPRCAADLYSIVLFGRGLPVSQQAIPVQTREAAEFADYIYDKRFDDGGAEAGGLLREFGIPYEPSGGLQAALFRGTSGTFYLVARGTEAFSIEDWTTNMEQASGGRTDAFESFKVLAEMVHTEITAGGGTMVCAGHSMGGALAIAGAHATGAAAESFNPSYVNDIYRRGAPAQIQVNVVYGDPLELYRQAAGLPPQGEMHYYHSLPARGMNHKIGHVYERP